MITPEQLSASGSESGSQRALMCWAASSGILELKWLFAIPNGFYGSAAQKGKMKAEGLRSGVADICLPVKGYNGSVVPSMYYNGLFLEMKQVKFKTHKDGGLSDQQVQFANFVAGQGYKFVIAYSWIEAKNVILQYLGKV